ncbi:MAG: Ger(x)C family spore germination protein [Clostridium sp.]|nr:Ger(x)C family spore germination protein [Clostridium sp.]
MKAKIRRVSSILVILLLAINLGGCFNYREINKITFATSIIFDVDEHDNVILYLDCVRPYRNANESSDKGRRIMFEGRGKTALEALRNVNVVSSNDLNFSQVRAYVFTEDAARRDIKNYLDLINNDQQFSFKPYMFVFKGDVKSLLDFTSNDEEYLGLYLNELIENNSKNGKVIKSNVNDYISNSLSYNNYSFMSVIEIKKDNVESKLELNGGVIMKDNHMIASLDAEDALTYNILMRKVGEGTFEVANPMARNKFIILDILEETNDTNIEVKDNDIVLKKDLNIRVSIGEIQDKLIINKDVLEEIKANEEWRIKRYEEEFFEKYKEKGIDVLGVGRLLSEKYPNVNVDKEDYLKNTSLDTKVNLIIDGSSLVKNSL